MGTNPYDIALMEPTLGPWAPTKPPSRQIAMLMSGGVDSSVSAHLLRCSGWDVLGVTMKTPNSCREGGRGCCGADAAFVCNDLSLPHYFVDVTEAFDRLIVEPFRDAYSQGRTPNPCVDCNTLLKFGLVWDYLEETLGITNVATGHYARVVRENGRVHLRRAKDLSKDQSYFLYGIPARRLDSFVLPLGDLTKQQVRSIASELGLSVADKAESMDLCFAGEQDYRKALDAGRANQPGDLVDMQGNKIGTHEGIAHYTLGQRRGLGFAGGEPLYVARIDPDANTVALGRRDEVSYRTVAAKQVNILTSDDRFGGSQVRGKIRSYGDPQPCAIRRLDGGGMVVEFAEPQFAPCPGQKLVLYDSADNVLAGGTIVLS